MRNLPIPEYLTPQPRFIQATADEVLDFVKGPPKILLVALDTETHYDEEVGGVIRFIDGHKNNSPFGVSITVKTTSGYTSFWVTENITDLAPLLEDPEVAKILHNSKYDRHMLKNLGIDLAGQIWDTMIMLHLIDEEHWCNTPLGTKVMSKSLKNLAYHYLGEDGHLYEDMVSETRRIVGLNSERLKGDVSYKEACDAAPLIMKDYACSDTEFTHRLFELFLPMLLAQDLSVAYDTDIKATLAVFNMERAGIAVDMAYFANLEAELTTDMQSIYSEIWKILPMELNIRASRDLVQGFESLGITWIWFTDKGEPKVDDRVLKQFKEGVPAELATLVLRYRESAKLRDTFISQINAYVQNGRIHADFNICPRDNSAGGTVTGRLSSNSPNLHNIPKDDKRIRYGIVPTPGYIFVELDYDQQEYRLLAHYADDKAFSDIVKAGKDIHAGTAELLLRCTAEESLEKKYRDVGKKLNFSLVYGLGMAQLAFNLGYKIDVQTYNKANGIIASKGLKPWALPGLDDILVMLQSEEEKAIIRYYFSDEARAAIAKAAEVKNSYFAQFPDIQQFLKDCSKKAQYRGWVKTWTGRRRHFKDAKKEGYKGPNAVIQGGCGDVIKQKMYQLDTYLAPYKSRAVNNIHDALLFEIHEDELWLVPDIKRIMEDLPFSVPITVSSEEFSKSWGKA